MKSQVAIKENLTFFCPHLRRGHLSKANGTDGLPLPDFLPSGYPSSPNSGALLPALLLVCIQTAAQLGRICSTGRRCGAGDSVGISSRQPPTVAQAAIFRAKGRRHVEIQPKPSQ